jgi:hypothetical protein
MRTSGISASRGKVYMEKNQRLDVRTDSDLRLPLVPESEAWSACRQSLSYSHIGVP